jgi:hypothetical protein
MAATTEDGRLMTDAAKGPPKRKVRKKEIRETGDTPNSRRNGRK